MHSIKSDTQVSTVYDHLDAALSRGVTVQQLMALVDRYQRLSHSLDTLEYELSSPFARPREGT